MKEVKAYKKLIDGTHKFYYHVEWHTDNGMIAKMRCLRMMLNIGLVTQTTTNKWKFEVL